MKRMRVLPAVLSLLVCLSCVCLPAQAADAAADVGADIYISVPRTQVFEGDKLDVTVTLSRALQNVVSFDWQLRFDDTLFTLQSAAIGTSHADMRVSLLKTDADGAYYSISYVDRTSAGSVLQAGTVCTLTFRAAEHLTDDRTGTFSLVSEGVYDAAFDAISVSAGEAAAVKVRRVLPEKLVIDKLPDKTSYRYKDRLDTTGIQLSLVYNNGKTEPVNSGYACTPTEFAVQSGLPMFGLQGTVPVTVSYEGLQTAFNVQVRLTALQWIIKIVLFGWLWY